MKQTKLLNINSIKSARKVPMINGNYTIHAIIDTEQTLHISYELMPRQAIASYHLSITPVDNNQVALEFLSLNTPEVKSFWLDLVELAEAQLEQSRAEALANIHMILGEN